MGLTDRHLVEERVSSEELLQGNFLHVLRDTVRLPDGLLATREYAVHPGAVMVVPLTQDATGQTVVVLERQFRYPIGQVMVEFPAGKRDADEDLMRCAQRELREKPVLLLQSGPTPACCTRAFRIPPSTSISGLPVA